MITTLDCSGKTSYPLGTKYKMADGIVFEFKYNEGVTKEEIEKNDIQPAWINVLDKDSVLVCSAPVGQGGSVDADSSSAKDKGDNSGNKKRNLLIIPSVLAIVGVIYLTYRAIKK